MGHIAGSALRFGRAIAAAAVAFAGFKAIEFLKDSSKKAAEFELMATSFEILLGSVDKAKARIKALEEFSIITPFEPEELIRTSKLLQTLAGDTMAIGKGLEMVGDAAAVAQVPMEGVALQAGRLFQALTEGGTGGGQALARLEELGLLTKGFKQKITDLTDAQRKGKEPLLSNTAALALMGQAMGKTGGAMARLSQTFAGKISTMKGNIGLLKIAIGTGINRGLEDGVNAMNEKLPEMRDGATAIGNTIGMALADAMQGNTALLEAGVTVIFLKLGELSAAAFLMALTKTMTRAFPAVLDWAADMLDSIPILKYLPSNMLGVGAMRGTAKSFRGMDDNSFDIGDYAGLTGGAFGSDEAADNLAELIRLKREDLEIQHRREFLEGKRSIIDGAYGPLHIEYR